MTRTHRRNLIRILLGAALLLTAVLLPPQSALPRLILLVAAYLLVGWDVLWAAGRRILQGQLFDENFLMSLATLGAFAIGEYPEAAAVMLFYQTGEWFQVLAVHRSRQSISALMDIRPDRHRGAGRPGVHPLPEEVEVGETILIKPGERVPWTGGVGGVSALNTAALTAKPPRDVSVGDEVISGCVSVSGLLRVKVATLRRVHRGQDSGFGGECRRQRPKPRASSPASPWFTPPWWYWPRRCCL